MDENRLKKRQGYFQPRLGRFYKYIAGQPESALPGHALNLF
jgi:hypothetical protein